MATVFLEPGGDSDFAVNTTTFSPGTGTGFWDTIGGAPAVATDFVNGTHIKSIKYRPNQGDNVNTAIGTLADTGTRISMYIYIVAQGTGTKSAIWYLLQSDGTTSTVRLFLTSAGVLQLWNGNTAQIGSDGATLSTGKWYRISLAYTITNGSTNRFELFVNGTSSISITNATITNVSTSQLRLGNLFTDTTLDFRSSDHYIDSSNALTDPGNIWVTAKRPNANGTTNGFTTQIGAGGSGYGTGHSPQVNERPVSTTNGWAMVGAGSAVTEEYSIENKSTGDIDISTATIVDYLGWVCAKALANETASIVVGGTSSNISLTNATATVFTKVKGSSTYPGGGTDIGIITATTLTTVSLYECGIMVAFIPFVASPAVVSHNLSLLGVGT